MWQSQASAGAARRGGASPAELGTAAPGISAKILAPELDRLAVRRAVGRVVPGVVVARERVGRRHALGGDQPFQGGEPMVVVGLAGVGIAGRLGALDLPAERGGPLGP